MTIVPVPCNNWFGFPQFPPRKLVLLYKIRKLEVMSDQKKNNGSFFREMSLFKWTIGGKHFPSVSLTAKRTSVAYNVHEKLSCAPPNQYTLTNLWCKMQVGGAQCRLMVHNVTLLRCTSSSTNPSMSSGILYLFRHFLKGALLYTMLAVVIAACWLLPNSISVSHDTELCCVGLADEILTIPQGCLDLLRSVWHIVIFRTHSDRT